MLFQIEFNQKADLPEHLELYLESLADAEEEDKAEIELKFNNILPNIKAIDGLIDEKTTGWKTSRMNKVDLTLLRLAVYEMKYDEDIPVGVAINEAVELAKKYSGEEGPSFVNGVLAKIV